MKWAKEFFFTISPKPTLKPPPSDDFGHEVGGGFRGFRPNFFQILENLLCFYLRNPVFYDQKPDFFPPAAGHFTLF